MSDQFTDNDLDPEDDDQNDWHPAERRKTEKKASERDEAVAKAARLEKQLAIARNPDLRSLNEDQLDVLVDRLKDDADPVELAQKLFNVTPPAPPEQTTPEERQAHQRIADAASTGTVAAPADLVSEIGTFQGSEAEFNALMASRGLLVEG